MLRSLLLMVALLFVCGSSQAQQVTPQIRIVDVMPVDTEFPPQSPIFALDFLIGAWPHPAWWGRPWMSSNSTEPDSPLLRDFNGRLTAHSGKGTTPVGYIYCCSYAPRWNEALGLYTVRVRVPFEGKKWPQKTKLNFRGELPAPFTKSSDGSALPFEVEFEEYPTKGIADAQLLAPRPSLWVKSVRIFSVVPNKTQHYNYEANVQLAGRRAQLRHMVRSLGSFVDATGKGMAHSGNAGAYGIMEGSGFPDSSTANAESRQSPFEFVLYGTGWSDSYAKAAANVFYQQPLEYGGRERLQITFPIARDGVPLVGEIPATEWKIESPSPAAN